MAASAGVACTGASGSSAATPARGPGLPTRPLAPALHRGMNLAHVHRPGQGYGSTHCRQELAHLAKLGLSHVALTPFGYLPSLTGTEIRFGASMDPTLGDAQVAAAAADARALGLSVCLKPHLWANAFWSSGKSRQDVLPDPAEGGWGAWFEQYRAFAVHYAKLAQAVEADTFVIGLEFLRATEQNPGAWADIAAACRPHFGGALSYGANWWAELQAMADWAAFDQIGVQAYFPLTEAPHPSAQTLLDAWTPHMDQLQAMSDALGKPIAFLECGLAAVTGAAARPWDHGLDGPADPALQAAGYQALLSAIARRPCIGSFYLWKWFTHPSRAAQDIYCPRGRPAETVLGEWLGRA